MDKVKHFNIISSVLASAPSPWMTTLDNNEIIEFKTLDGTQRNVNSLTIWSNSTALYIQVGTSDYCVYIPANSSISLDYLQLQQITVLGLAGIELRWTALYY
jgi:hypothetical protein